MARASVFIALLMLAVYAAYASPELKEVARVPSPDRQFDAVLVEVEVDAFGATVSTPYRVYIVPTGSKKFEYPIMKGAQFAELRLVWKDPQLLEIQYSKGQIYAFQNFWYFSREKHPMGIVEVGLAPTSEHAL
jgi:hypothetical protein